jgi:hypothetical protein
MVFKKGDPETIRLARIAGRKGKKHFSDLENKDLRELSRKAGIASGKARRKKRDKKVK